MLRKLIISFQHYARYFQVLAKVLNTTKMSQCIEILEFFRQVCNNCSQYLSQLVFVHSLNVKCIIYSIQLICVKANHRSLFQQMFSKQIKEAFICLLHFKWLLGSEGDDILHGFLSLKKSTSCNLMLFHYISTQENTHRPSTLTVTHINLNSCIIIKHIIRNTMNANTHTTNYDDKTTTE